MNYEVHSIVRNRNGDPVAILEFFGHAIYRFRVANATQIVYGIANPDSAVSRTTPELALHAHNMRLKSYN